MQGKEVGRLVPELFLFFKKALYKVKASGQHILLDLNLDIAFASYYVYDFPRKTVLILYSVNWLDVIAWLPLFLKILGNMCIATIYCPVCNVINFEINRSFPIKLFF